MVECIKAMNEQTTPRHCHHSSKESSARTVELRCNLLGRELDLAVLVDDHDNVVAEMALSFELLLVSRIERQQG